MGWSQAVKLKEDVNNHSRSVIDALKEEVKTIIDENIYLLPSQSYNDIIAERNRSGDKYISCIFKRKGTVTVYISVSREGLSEFKTYVTVKVNGVVAKYFIVTLPQNYLSYSGYVDIDVEIGDLVEIEIEKSVLVDVTATIRGKIHLKGGVVE